MLNIAVEELTAAGWTQLGEDHWLDGLTGSDATYAQAVIQQAERGRGGQPPLSRANWRALRTEELQLALQEYGRLTIEHVASVSGINLLLLDPNISDHDLIVAIVDHEEEQRSAAMTPCPTCEREHDTLMRMTGDVIHCPGCNAFLRVQHGPNGTRLLPAPVPPGGLALLLAQDAED